MNNMSISMGKRQLVDSIWKSAGIEGLEQRFQIQKKYCLIFQYKHDVMKSFLS